MTLEEYGKKVVEHTALTLQQDGYSESEARSLAAEMVWGGADSLEAARCQNALQKAMDSGKLAWTFSDEEFFTP